MSKQRESKLSGAIRDMANAKPGVWGFKIHGGPTMVAGLPDLIFCVRGRFVAIETKLPETRNNLSERQKYIHAKLRKAGATVVVCCGVKEAEELIDRLIDLDDSPID